MNTDNSNSINNFKQKLDLFNKDCKNLSTEIKNETNKLNKEIYKKTLEIKHLRFIKQILNSYLSSLFTISEYTLTMEKKLSLAVEDFVDLSIYRRHIEDKTMTVDQAIDKIIYSGKSYVNSALDYINKTLNINLYLKKFYSLNPIYGHILTFEPFVFIIDIR